MFMMHHFMLVCSNVFSLLVMVIAMAKAHHMCQEARIKERQLVVSLMTSEVMSTLNDLVPSPESKTPPAKPPK